MPRQQICGERAGSQILDKKAKFSAGYFRGTPLKSFKEAFKAGLIDESQEGIFVEMIEKRNQIVHIYDLEQTKDIYNFIKDAQVFSAIESLYDRLALKR